MSRSVSLLRRLRLRFMGACPGLYVRLSRLYNRLLWKAERQGMQGKLKPDGFPSVLFFSYYRCGSMFLSRALRDLAGVNGFQHLDYDSYFAKVNQDESARLFRGGFLEKAFHPHGLYFGTLRRAYPIPDQEKYRSVVLLRDPRDCLVSHYYSIRESHTLNNFDNLRARKEARALEVDEWVLQHAEEYRRDFLDFHHRLLGKPGVLFLPYEEMVTAFPDFIRKVVEHTGMNRDEAAVDRIIAEADFSVAGESILSHKRSVKPGNHRKKLKPETVKELNEALAEVLELYGYQ